MRIAPFEHDTLIFSLGQDGIISASDISNYLLIKRKYSVYFTNVVCFPDVDKMTDPLKKDLEKAINSAIKDLGE